MCRVLIKPRASDTEHPTGDWRCHSNESASAWWYTCLCEKGFPPIFPLKTGLSLQLRKGHGKVAVIFTRDTTWVLHTLETLKDHFILDFDKPNELVFKYNENNQHFLCHTMPRACKTVTGIWASPLRWESSMWGEGNFFFFELIDPYFLCGKQKYFPYLFWVCIIMVAEVKVLNGQRIEKIWERAFKKNVSATLSEHTLLLSVRRCIITAMLLAGILCQVRYANHWQLYG